MRGGKPLSCVHMRLHERQQIIFAQELHPCPMTPSIYKSAVSVRRVHAARQAKRHKRLCRFDQSDKISIKLSDGSKKLTLCRFFHQRHEYEREAALYRDPVLSKLLPELLEATGNDDSAVRSRSGLPLPPFMVLERGASLLPGAALCGARRRRAPAERRSTWQLPYLGMGRGMSLFQ